MVWGFIGGILILIEFSFENLKILSLSRKLNAKEAEVIQLKAQLYDQQKSDTASEASSDRANLPVVEETKGSQGQSEE